MEVISTLVLEGKLTHPMDLLTCRFTKNENEILTGAADGVIRKINYSDMTMTRQYTDDHLDKSGSPVTSIKFSPFSDICVATYAHGYIKYWNLSTGECLRTIFEDSEILGCGVSPLLRIFVTASASAKLTVYDMESGVIKRTLEGSYRPDFADGHKSRVFTAKFHPVNANELLSGGWDKTVQFWDLRRASSVRYLPGPNICGDGIDIDPTGEQVLTCSFDEEKNLCLWDYKTGELLRDFTPDTSRNYYGGFMGAKHVITAGSCPSLLRIINMDSWSVVATYSTALKGLYSADCWEPKSSRRQQAVKIITIASHMLIKMKFLYRRSSDFPYTEKKK